MYNTRARVSLTLPVQSRQVEADSLSRCRARLWRWEEEEEEMMRGELELQASPAGLETVTGEGLPEGTSSSNRQQINRNRLFLFFFKPQWLEN